MNKIEKIKTYYDKGFYNIADIQKLLNSGKITAEEYFLIVDKRTEKEG